MTAAQPLPGTETPVVSVILTTYNEGFVIAESTAMLRAMLERLRYPFEIIIADDGSTDNSRALAEELARQDPRVRAVGREHNRGRGQTVEDGIRAARGRYVGFIDTDLEIPPENILTMLLALERGAEAVIGFRLYTLDMNYTARWIMSVVYAKLMKYLLNLPFADTEAGIKFFRRESILPVLDRVTAKGWPWDTEIVVKSYHAGLKVEEVLVTVVKRPGIPTTVKIVSTIIDYLKNLQRLRREMRGRLRPRA